MDGPSDDKLFALALKSIALGGGKWDIESCDEESSKEDVLEDIEGDEDSSCMVVRLSTGQWHVCKGMKCAHVEMSNEGDRQYTCRLSGRVVSGCQESAHDASWTGRSCTSADPDMQSGAVSGVSAWKGKRNAFSASAAAYAVASHMTIEDISFGAQAPSSPLDGSEAVCDSDRVLQSAEEANLSSQKDAQDPKRGAPCIVDVDEEALNNQKREKALKRIASLQDNAVQARLRSDASSVVVKLFSVTNSSRQSPQQQLAHISKKDRAVSGGAVTLSDPRLENYDFVLNMAFKRYAARCKEQGCSPTVSEIHDVCIAANQFVKQRRREAQDRTASATSSRKIAMNGITVDYCSQLILTLWCAMCTTPYFVGNQTGDSFRPFAAGVMYAFKRGLRLPNNMILVPAIEEIASQLPTLRSSTATNAAKQLQQASHRGLCSIQRGIASIDTMSPEEQAVAIKKLKVVSGVAARLSRFVRENAD